MDIIRFENQQDFIQFFQHNPLHKEHQLLEQGIMSVRQDKNSFSLDGYCKACDSHSSFQVDKLYGSIQTDQGWLPNWRERLICPECQLNNRQRAMIHIIKQAVLEQKKKNNPENSEIKLYAMEQITPLFSWLKNNLDLDCIGSEYLGEDIKPGSLVNGIIPNMRHENVQDLSFDSNSLDLIVSNDVLEHVDQPHLAISEMGRILKPEGEVFISVPFYTNRQSSESRAGFVNGKLVHHLSEQYHGNPLSEKGSLVFQDYGWDFLDWLRGAGFKDVAMCSYWSYFYFGNLSANSISQLIANIISVQ